MKWQKMLLAFASPGLHIGLSRKSLQESPMFSARQQEFLTRG